MKKTVKVSLLVVATIAIYAGFYYFLVINATPETYTRNVNGFFDSVIFAIIGVPIGALVSWFLGKKNLDKQKQSLILFILAIVWGYVFGWFSLMGVAIGGSITEKDKKLTS